MNKTPKKICVCVSGGGRSLRNLILKQDGITWNVSAVVSSGVDCKANDIAKEFSLPLFVGDFSRQHLSGTSEKLKTFLVENNIDWIVLAGFLKLFPIPEAWTGKIVNIHPALLPKHGGKGMHGLHVHKAVLEAGDKISGATVHFVNERYDDGATISQVLVETKPNDTPERLAARVFEAECQLLPATLTKLIQGQLPHADGQPWKVEHHGKL